MPSGTRIPFPSNIAFDPDFRIDIVEPRSGAVGLCVSKVLNVEGFRATCRLGRGQTERDALLSPECWSLFMRTQLDRMSQHIQGLYTPDADLVPPVGLLPRAVHAFIPGGPRYDDLPTSLTTPALYTNLHEVLADILACQAVWYVRTLWQCPEVAEKASQHPGPNGEVWQEWRWACRHPEVDFLDTLYIMSIRRIWTASTWAYFPEVEIRSP